MKLARSQSVAALILALCMLCACEYRAERPPDANRTALEPTPQQESWDVTYRIAEGDARRVHLRAGHAAEYAEADSTYILLTDTEGTGRVAVELFDAAGDTSATLTADRVRYYEEERRFAAYGDVQVRTSDDKQLYTEELIWEEEHRTIHAPGFVRLHTPTELIRGYDLRGNEDLTSYRLGEVTGQYVRDSE